MINTILNEKNQTVITKLIENYVTENEKFIDNPEIQEVIQPAIPSFFGNADNWASYVGKLDNIGYLKMTTRFMFLEYLLLRYKYNRHNNNNFLAFLEENKESFDRSDDRRYLAKFGILRSVNDNIDRYGKDLLSTWQDPFKS